MSKSEIIEIYEAFLKLGPNDDPNETILADHYYDIDLEADNGDETAKKLRSVFDELMSGKLDNQEAASVIIRDFKVEYDIAKSIEARYDDFTQSLTAYVERYFSARGYETAGELRFVKREASSIKAIMLLYQPGILENGELRVYPLISCSRSKISRGRVKLLSSEVSADRRIKFVKRKVPAESFDPFDSSVSSRAQFSTVITCAPIFNVMFDENGGYKYPDTDNEFPLFPVSNSKMLFEGLEPYLDAACSILDNKKPNKTYLESFKKEHWGSRELLKYLFPFFLLSVAVGSLLFGGAILLFELIFGDAPPFNWLLYAGTGLCFGFCTSLCVFIAILIEEKRKYY